MLNTVVISVWKKCPAMNLQDFGMWKVQLYLQQNPDPGTSQFY